MTPAHRPSLLALALRWRVELVGVLVIALVWRFTGGLTLTALTIAGAIVLATVPPVRQVAARGWQLVALPHRVRTALAEAGAVDRHGRLPWVLWAASAGPNVVRVEVKLRAGVVFEDIYLSIPHLSTACASPEVRVLLRSRRPDRVTILLVRPRWGLCG